MSSAPRPRPGLRPRAAALVLAAGAAVAALPARAERDPSTASTELSALPLALSVAVPLSVLAAGGAFVVVSVQLASEATVYVLERVADGLRFTVRVAGRAMVGASELAGAAVVVTLAGTGYLLCAAGRVIAYVPGETSRGLMYHREVLP